MKNRLVLGCALAVSLLVSSALPTLAISGGTNAKKQVCTPGYSPCIVLKTSDVDCWWGTGNGPRYSAVGVVYHVQAGKDRYGLDADHDGLGCERS